MKKKQISGFSKLSKRGKIKWIVENFFKDPENVMRELMSHWHINEDQQKIFDGFSENTISNYSMPYGVAPNFVIDGKTYCVPMVIEESSVVAAAASAAKFWMTRGGFRTEILGTIKEGQVHFKWNGDIKKLKSMLDELKAMILTKTKTLTQNMEKRGGGILDIELVDFTHEMKFYYQLKLKFDTRDSMGANFINSILEMSAVCLEEFLLKESLFENQEKDVEIIMSILSNYTPYCKVKASVECDIKDLGDFPNDISAEKFAEKFWTAVNIAKIDPFRAATHNKGIFNGIDAVVLATGNDFRAVESCGHTYASRSGNYKSLSDCEIKNGRFRFWLEIPLSLGTVGGLTSLHPIARTSLELLENPDAQELMRITAATGLAQNFAALRSLITTGIQQGHMRMHLINILNHLDATEAESNSAIEYFSSGNISYTVVREFILSLRNENLSVSK